MNDRQLNSSSRELLPTTGSAVSGIEYGGFAEAEVQRQPENALNIGRIIGALFRYKWLCLAIIILGTSLSVAATRLIRPRYWTSATIYVENNTQTRTGPIVADDGLRNESWRLLMRSFAVVDPVVVANRLYLSIPERDSSAFERFALAETFRPGRYKLQIDPTGARYTLLTAQGSQIETGATGDSVGRRLGFRWAPPVASLGRDREIAFGVRTPRSVSESLIRTLRANIGDLSSFMTVSLEDTDPIRVTTTLNAILDQFMVVAAELKRAKLASINADLVDQLRIADSTMRKAETDLESFRISTITQPKLEQQSPVAAGLQQTQPTVMTSYFNKRIELANLQKDRRAIEELLRQATQGGSVPVDAFYTIPAVKQAPDLMTVLGEVSKTEAELRALRGRYTDEYGGIKTLVAQSQQLATQTVPLYVNRLVTQLREQENRLENEIRNDTDELREIPARSHTEERLRRDAQTAVTLTLDLKNRLQNARLVELSATPDVRIMDRAVVPDQPSSNTAPRIVLMGIAGSFALAFGLAVLLDRFDKRFRYPEQVTQGLGLTILGAIPVIRKSRGAVLSPVETAQIVESFRSVRLNLAHSFVDGEAITLTISSPSPGDGKSLISANLAMSFAEAGYQTILIDGDTRRGELYRVFGVDRRPGLLDYLEGNAEVDDVIRTTAHAGLSMIPCGTRTARGPELLSSSSMVDLIKVMRSRYQVVLVDSPPLGAGIDPFVLGTVTGNVVLVLRAGETDRELAEAKLELMNRLPTRLVGAILNHIDVGKGSYKYYAYDYTPRDDAEPAAGKKPELGVPAGAKS